MRQALSWWLAGVVLLAAALVLVAVVLPIRLAWRYFREEG